MVLFCELLIVVGEEEAFCVGEAGVFVLGWFGLTVSRPLTLRFLRVFFFLRTMKEIY